MPSTSLVFNVTRAPGWQPNRVMSILRANCIARYKMHSILGRPEELAKRMKLITAQAPDVGPVKAHWDGDHIDRVISFGYLHGSIRIRKHGGDRNRAWIDHVDLRLDGDWMAGAFDFLDEWLGYRPPVVQYATILPPNTDTIPARPIRDNPQA